MRDRFEKSHLTIFGTLVEATLRVSRSADRSTNRDQNSSVAAATSFRADWVGPSTTEEMADSQLSVLCSPATMRRFNPSPLGLLRPALVLASAVLATTAHAQIHIPVYTGTPLLITSGVLNQQIVRSATQPIVNSGDTQKERLSPKAESASTVVAGAPVGYAAKLAQSYPAAQRPQAQRVFNELLDGYRNIEGQFGISRHDLAGAVAAFVAGSFMAYRNVDFPDASFRTLVEQMRNIITSTAEFSSASATEKREMYEQMAILGMFMATTQMALKKQPDPALQSSLRQSAREYLETFLRVDADRVQITSAGLSVR